MAEIDYNRKQIEKNLLSVGDIQNQLFDNGDADNFYGTIDEVIKKLEVLKDLSSSYSPVTIDVYVSSIQGFVMEDQAAYNKRISAAEKLRDRRRAAKIAEDEKIRQTKRGEYEKLKAIFEPDA